MPVAFPCPHCAAQLRADPLRKCRCPNCKGQVQAPECDTIPPYQPAPAQSPATGDDVAALRAEIQHLRQAVSPKPKEAMGCFSAGLLVIGVGGATLLALIWLTGTMPRFGGSSTRPDLTPPPNLYGMTAEECIARWGKPNHVTNPEGPATILHYDGAGVGVVLGSTYRGRATIRFDDRHGNKMNAFEADRKIRGVQ